MDDALDLYYRLLGELENLARFILEGKLHSAQDGWQFEIDLAKFQLEQQQKIIAEGKYRKEINACLKEVCRAKKGGWEAQRQQYQTELQQNKDRVNIYSHANDIARKLGDTLAWIFLDRIQIKLRNRDSSMRSSGAHRMPAEKHGLQGMLAVAEVLYRAGAGFPILHDITHCLRIGDITFYSTEGDPLTIEVKTKLKGYRGDSMILGIEILCVNTSAQDARWNAILARMPQEIALSQDMTANDHTLQQPQEMEEGLKRQLEKLARVTVWQGAQDNKSFELGERKVGVVLRLTTEQSMHHYDLLQELIHDAGPEGFACRSADDAFVYTAIYRDTPLWLLENEQFIPENKMENYQRVNLSIVFPESEANYAVVYDVFNNPPFVRPFFLYPLPTNAIIDMMWRRMYVFVTVNLGKVVAALQSTGLNARLPENKQEFDEQFLHVSTDISLPDGRSIYGLFRGLQFYGAQMIHEFLSLQGFVNLISSTAEVTVEETKKKEMNLTIDDP